MGKIVLYYKYVNIEDPKEIAKWMRQLCEGLGLKCRIILSTEGVNGTLGGSEDAIEKYKQAMSAHPLFHDIEFKESRGSSNDFPKISIKIRKEIVALGVENINMENKGEYLTPEQAHDLLNEQPDNLVIIDCRNTYESRIGHFRNAVRPNTKYFREFPKYIDDNLQKLKDKKVFMYCTGGIRCEKASAYVKEQGVNEVYHLKGGIHKYVEQYPDGHFRGQNYVFDDRIALKINDDILDSCDICKKPFDEITNCRNSACNNQFLVCKDCKLNSNNACSAECLELIDSGKVHARDNYRTGSTCEMF